MPLQLKVILKEIKAMKIFPIHTENAELFAKFMQNLKSQVILTEKGKGYNL
jgi:mRNA degradation ribonuclease J1/J2